MALFCFLWFAIRKPEREVTLLQRIPYEFVGSEGKETHAIISSTAGAYVSLLGFHRSPTWLRPCRDYHGLFGLIVLSFLNKTTGFLLLLMDYLRVWGFAIGRISRSCILASRLRF